MRKSMLFGVVAVLSMLGVANVETLSFGPKPANAVVYCKAYGVPRGCVARPGAPAAVVHPVPAVHRPVVYCRAVGVPKGCVMR